MKYYNYIQNKIKNDKNYYCTDEYKSLYPIMMKLYKEEGFEEKRNNRIKRNRQISKLNKEHGIGLLF